MLWPLTKPIEYKEPAEVLKLFSDQEWINFLDSAKQSDDFGNYSFIVFNPFLKIIASNNQVSINKQTVEGDPFLILQQQLSRYKFTPQKNLPPFQGGAVGYFSYNLLHHLEKVPQSKSAGMAVPEMVIGFYDTVISFDHQARLAWVISHGLSEEDGLPNPQKAEENCNFIINKLSEQTALNPLKNYPLKKLADIKSNFEPHAYQEMIKKVIAYIYAGDIFQANLSQCFSATLPASMTSLDLYLKLRDVNPAPFAAFLDYGDFAIASASPERFLKLTAKNVETRPIKGTRRRSLNPDDDKLLAEELLASSKDQAENTMIVDLMRNDLSRVCESHSVVVKKLCGLETYATVHHLVSIIEGKLKAEFDAIDLLRATFPGGSIAGAPKVRAMEIISELEPTARGPYCGSIGYIGFDGAMDTSIVIRTFLMKGNKITFQAGGGIVADSIALDEYLETLTKAKSLFNVLTGDG